MSTSWNVGQKMIKDDGYIFFEFGILKEKAALASKNATFLIDGQMDRGRGTQNVTRLPSTKVKGSIERAEMMMLR